MNEPNAHKRKVGELASTGVEKTFNGGLWVSNKMFTLLKFFALSCLFIIIIYAVKNAFSDRDKISIKPFSIPEEMQGSHKGAGSIIANIIKSKLIIKRGEIDKRIKNIRSDEEETGPRTPVSSAEKKIFVLSSDAFKSANIKLPETGISINDVTEFISGVFGRKNITGSVYKDNNELHLQIEMGGSIIDVKQKLLGENTEITSPLHIKEINMMSDEINRSILSLASEKYRVYYYCTDTHVHSNVRYNPNINHPNMKFKDDLYKKLSEKCDGVIDILSLEIEVNDEFRKKRLGILEKKLDDKLEALAEDTEKITVPYSKQDKNSDFEYLQRYIFTILRTQLIKRKEQLKREFALSSSSSSKDQQIIPEITDQVLDIVGTARKKVEPVTRVSQSGQVDMDAPDAPLSNQEISVTKNDGKETVLTNESISILSLMIKYCDTTNNSTTSVLKSNNLEENASAAYRKGGFSKAKDLYISAIKINCKNKYAWANLGVMFSDLKNSDSFDPISSSIALTRATEISEKSGWMWHSLCVAEAYNKNENYENAINSSSCDKARLVEPGKQIIFDKLFYVAIADIYNRDENFEKAFKFYKRAIALDPKRTCKLKAIVDKTNSLKKIDEKTLNTGICEALTNSYPASNPDLICEESLTKIIDECKKANTI